MSEQQRTIAIKHVSAGAEIARGPTPDVWTPHAGDSRPIEPLPASVRRFAILRQQAKASRVTLSNILNCFSQCLKDRARRVGERADQRPESVGFLSRNSADATDDFAIPRYRESIPKKPCLLELNSLEDLYLAMRRIRSRCASMKCGLRTPRYLRGQVGRNQA